MSGEELDEGRVWKSALLRVTKFLASISSEGVTTDVVGAFRPQFIVGVDDYGVVVEERR